MEIGDGSGICWITWKQPAPCSRQTTTSTPHHSIFTGRMPLPVPNKQCRSTEGNKRRIIQQGFSVQQNRTTQWLHVHSRRTNKAMGAYPFSTENELQKRKYSSEFYSLPKFAWNVASACAYKKRCSKQILLVNKFIDTSPTWKISAYPASEATPSCMRAPPESFIPMSGAPTNIAWSITCMHQTDISCNHKRPRWSAVVKPVIPNMHTHMHNILDICNFELWQFLSSGLASF